jgi:AcrR family transcriptional regulator
VAEESEPIIWMRPEITGHGKAPAYSREQIAKSAVAIADAEGIEAVSMRRVAREIGAGTMSLYRYVRTKDELYALMVDWVCAPSELPSTPSTDRLELLRDYGRGVRALVIAHPWYPGLQAGLGAPTPNMIRGMEVILPDLDRPEQRIDELVETVTTVMIFSTGFAQNELAEARASMASGLDTHERMRRYGHYVCSLVESGEFPYLRKIVVDTASPHEEDPEAAFERALDRLVAGIEATTGRSGSP